MAEILCWFFRRCSLLVDKKTNKVVIPVASLGMRMLPAAKAIFEELLLVGIRDAVAREYVRDLLTMIDSDYSH